MSVFIKYRDPATVETISVKVCDYCSTLCKAIQSLPDNLIIRYATSCYQIGHIPVFHAGIDL